MKSRTDGKSALRAGGGAGLCDLLPERGGDCNGSFHCEHERAGGVQALGNKASECVERYAELAKQNAGTGTVAAPILYEENDGVWLKLQGKDRRGYGADKEMKVGITYDGVTRDAAKRGRNFIIKSPTRLLRTRKRSKITRKASFPTVLTWKQ